MWKYSSSQQVPLRLIGNDLTVTNQVLAFDDDQLIHFIFRVPIFFEQLDTLREELRVWGDRQGNQLTSARGVVSSVPTCTPFSIFFNGDQVEANLLGLGYAQMKSY